MFKFSKKSLDMLDGVDPQLKLLAIEVLKISPFDIGITSGYRTVEEQMKMYQNKVSKCDGIKNKSKHQEGKAIDIICYNEISIITHDERYYISVSEVFKQKAKELKIKIKWGGDRKNFKDYSHFELI